jgi:hypothetical protein
VTIQHPGLKLQARDHHFSYTNRKHARQKGTNRITQAEHFQPRVFRGGSITRKLSLRRLSFREQVIDDSSSCAAAGLTGELW